MARDSALDSRDPRPDGREPDLLGSWAQSLRASRSIIEKLALFRKSLAGRLLRRGIGHSAFRSSPVGEIPASWDVRSLGEIASLTSGRTKPKDSSYLQSHSQPVPIYAASGLVGFTSRALQTGSTIVIGRIGARSGSVYFVSDEACWITDNALFVYETRRDVELRFLYHSLCHLDLRSLRSTGRQPLISLSAIYPVPVALPPLAEQREISEALHALETLIETQEKVVAQSDTLRSALLAREAAGSGELPQ